jgi:hypothetical protein
MGLILYLIGIVITYYVIKLAVKNAISESLVDAKSVIRGAIVDGLSEYEYKKQNK